MKTKIILPLAALALGLNGLAHAEQITLETAPPVVVKTVPVAGATEVDPALTEIKVTFSKAMQDGSWSWSTWGEENFPEMVGQPKYLADGRTCVLTVKLEPNKFYATWLNSEKFHNFKDVSGRPAAPYLLTFYTGESANNRLANSGITAAEGVGAAVAQKIKSEVLRQLKSRSAKVDELLVTVAVARDSATPFKVTYRGLRNFKGGDGKLVSPPDGEFVMGYIGGGQWQGALAGVQFTAQAGSVDKIDLPFVNDPAVIGEWQSVDFVSNPSEFNPDKRAWSGELYLKGMTFQEGGKFPQSWQTWTRGAVVHSGDKTASRYEIREIKGQSYLFFEWKSGDVTILGRKPSYYVLKKVTTAESAAATSPKSEAAFEREINRPVNEFPEARDLSTPESACAAWQRASAHKDALAVSQLSLVPLDAKEQENWYSQQEKRDADGLAIYLKALADSKIVAVQTWRRELANVVTFLPFPEGKGRSPYSARAFGRVNGEWKNLGEDRLPTAEAAKAGFEKKKERLWQQFSDLKGKSRSAQAAAARKFVRVVLDDQRMTFEGEPVDWQMLENKLSAVGDRDRTVLEWAVPSTQITLQQQAEWSGRFARLARQHGFEYSSYVGVHPFGSKGGAPPVGHESSPLPATDMDLPLLLNDDQKAVLAWTDRQFRSFFDARTFEGWSEKERADLETRLIDTLNGPLSREYYQAINSLAALRSSKALPKLRAIAFDRADKDCRDRWMAIRALGVLGDKTDVPELIHLVYHGNVNTRWWAQISLVRLTGQNFAKDWNAWGNWWNAQKGQPPFKPEIIRWWNGQAEPEKLAASLDESDRKFLGSIKT